MGRTEADRSITSEPQSSRPRSKTTKEAEEQTLLSDGRSLLKKCLTGPTLLEMSGKAGNQDLWDHKAAADRVEHEARGFMNIQLLHEPGAVRLGSFDTYTQHGGNILCRFPLGN
jgi:hypothetical protein